MVDKLKPVPVNGTAAMQSVTLNHPQPLGIASKSSLGTRSLPAMGRGAAHPMAGPQLASQPISALR